MFYFLARRLCILFGLVIPSQTEKKNQTTFAYFSIRLEETAPFDTSVSKVSLDTTTRSGGSRGGGVEGTTTPTPLGPPSTPPPKKNHGTVRRLVWRRYCVTLLYRSHAASLSMGFAVRVRSAGQKYGPRCHQRDRADVTEIVTLARLSSFRQHVGVLALAGYKRRKSALTTGPIKPSRLIIKAEPRGCLPACSTHYTEG